MDSPMFTSGKVKNAPKIFSTAKKDFRLLSGPTIVVSMKGSRQCTDNVFVERLQVTFNQGQRLNIMMKI
jgi:hypothetical protein